MRVRTAVRNRVHILLDRQQTLEMPQRSDLFTGRGMKILRGLRLPDRDQALLDQNLECLEMLDHHVKTIEKEMTRLCRENEDLRLLCSIPGLGVTLGPVIGLEIDDIARFARSDRLVAYARACAQHALQRGKNLPRQNALAVQPLVEMGLHRGGVGGCRLQSLLRRDLPPIPSSRYGRK